MKKIPTLLKRDPDNRALVLPEFEVELSSEAIPTPKWDGTCVMLNETGEWFARREVKKDGKVPDDFTELNFDPVTGKRQGWVLITEDPNFKWHNEVIKSVGATLSPGTYELVGPAINGNPHKFQDNMLLTHGWDTSFLFHSYYRDYWLRDWFNEDGTANISQITSDMEKCPYEGWVFWADGEPVAKLKRRDFGFDWPMKGATPQNIGTVRRWRISSAGTEGTAATIKVVQGEFYPCKPDKTYEKVED